MRDTQNGTNGMTTGPVHTSSVYWTLLNSLSDEDRSTMAEVLARSRGEVTPATRESAPVLRRPDGR